MTTPIAGAGSAASAAFPTAATGAAPTAGASVTAAVAATVEPGITAVRADSIASLHARLAERSGAIRDALLSGQLVQDGMLDTSGITGPPQRLRVLHDSVGEIGAIGKSAAGNYVLAEQFANDLAERMGIGHLVAPVVERDGRVVIAMVDGVQAREAGLQSANDLEASLRRFYAQHTVGVSPDDIARQARIDRQLVQVFDQALAIADRHGRNLLGNPATGAITLIDHSEMLSGQLDDAHAAAPFMMRRFQAGTGVHSLVQTVRIDDDVRALLRERVPSGTVDSMLEELRAKAGDGFTPERAGRLVDPEKAAAIGKRLDVAAETGLLRSRYIPLREFQYERLGNLLDDSPAFRSVVNLFRRI